MSVPVGKRQESFLEFKKVAADIEYKIFMIYDLLNNHKKQSFGKRLLRLGEKFGNELNFAECIYGKSVQDFEQRILHYNEARAACKTICYLMEFYADHKFKKIVLEKDYDGVEKPVKKEMVRACHIEELISLSFKECQLLSGVLKKEKEKYKKVLT